LSAPTGGGIVRSWYRKIAPACAGVNREVREVVGLEIRNIVRILDQAMGFSRGVVLLLRIEEDFNLTVDGLNWAELDRRKSGLSRLRSEVVSGINERINDSGLAD